MDDPSDRPLLRRWETYVLALGLGLVATGHAWGLFFAPAEAMMGEVGRILYVHVPTAWVCMVVYTIAFVAAVIALWNGKAGADATLQASAEVGMVLNGLLLIQGSLWARPTWGVYWTWDPRLTTTAVLFVLFGGVLAMRPMIADAQRRLTLSAIATIIAYVDVPVVYFAVKWFRTLHQPMSSPSTVASSMVSPLRVAAFGMLFLSIGLIVTRYRTVGKSVRRELSAPELPSQAAILDLGGPRAN